MGRAVVAGIVVAALVVALAAVWFLVADSGADVEVVVVSSTQPDSTATSTTELAQVPDATVPPRQLSQARIKHFEVALVSGDPLLLADVTGIADDDLLAGLASEGVPSGSRMVMDPSTFELIGDSEASVQTRIDGPRAASFVVYLRFDEGIGDWLVIATSEPLP